MKLTKLLVIGAISVAAFLSTPAHAQDSSVVNDINSSLGNTPAFMQPYTLWDGGYEKSNFRLVVGYVNKSWRCTYENGVSQREDFFGDPDDKFLHGFQIGGLYTPSFDWGLGMRTGLFFESYISRSKWITQYCNRFTEIDIYIPLQASYRIPFDEVSGMTLFGGMGFQWATGGKYSRQIGTAWPGWWWRRPVPIWEHQRHEYGNGTPQKVNWQIDCGIDFRINFITFSFTYSFGIKDHGIQNTFDEGKTYITSIKSRQDKMQAAIAFAF